MVVFKVPAKMAFFFFCDSSFFFNERSQTILAVFDIYDKAHHNVCDIYTIGLVFIRI